MTPLAARRAIIDNDEDIRRICIAPKDSELQMWLNNIEFRNSSRFTAWPNQSGNVKGFDALNGCLAQSVSAPVGTLKRAWASAWPEHVQKSGAALHTFGNDYTESDRHSFRFDLSAYKVKTGLFAKKFLIFISISFNGGGMPLGFAPAKDLRLAIGLANMIMDGDEAPFRSVKNAIADTTI